MWQTYVIIIDFDFETYNGLKVRARQVDSEVSHQQQNLQNNTKYTKVNSHNQELSLCLYPKKSSTVISPFSTHFAFLVHREKKEGRGIWVGEEKGHCIGERSWKYSLCEEWRAKIVLEMVSCFGPSDLENGKHSKFLIELDQY